VANNFEEALSNLESNQYSWLITGSAGFIGSNLSEFLLKHNQVVFALDNFSTGLRSNIDFLEDYQKTLNNDSQFIFHEADIRNYDSCLELTKNINYVLHQAAIGSVPRSIKDPLTTHDSNINGFLNILLASKNNNIENFVYASSSSIYGDSPILPKHETHIGLPLSPYAVTKSVNETYASVFSKVYDFNSIGLRYFNVFGKRQDPNGQYAAVIPRWISALLSESNLFINGDGSTTRDFCYIDNAVQANILSALTNSKSSLNQVYNVAANHQISLNELFKIIKHNILIHKPNIAIKEPQYCDFRAGDIMHSMADIEKAENLLGYKVNKSVEEGLKELIRIDCQQ
jgi:UDP-N-acetylglucosamine/UDP-N-acetylgalactosamine 4-epimerase